MTDLTLKTHLEADSKGLVDGARAGRAEVDNLAKSTNTAAAAARQYNQSSAQMIQGMSSAARASKTLTEGMSQSGLQARNHAAAMEANRAATVASTGATNQLASSIRGLAAIYATLKIGQLTGEILRASDQYTRMDSALRLVTKSEAERVGLQKQLFNLAQETRSAYEPTVTLYARIARNADALNLSQAQLLSITELTNKAIRIGGQTAQESAAGVVQFSQALASGVLRGDEFKSIAENMPRLAMAIRNGLKLSQGELRAWAEEGKLTADVVIQAVLSQSEVIQTEFGKIETTIGETAEQASNSMDRLAASMSKRSGLTDATKDSISWFGLWADEVQRAIEKSDSFAEVLGRIQAIGMAASVGSLEEYSKAETARIDDIDLRERIRDRLARGNKLPGFYNKKNEDVVQFFPGTSASSPAPTIDADAIETFQKMSQQLRDQNALYGQTSKAVKIRYEIEKAGLDKVNPVLADYLIHQAEIADANIAATKAADESAKASKKAADESAKASKKAARERKREFEELEDLMIDGGNKLAQQQRKEMEDREEALKDRVSNLSAALLSETEAEQQRYQESLALLEQAEREKLATTMSYAELRARAETDHAKRLQDIADAANREQREKLEREAERQAEIMQAPFKNAVEGIQRSFTDAFKSLFSGGINTFGDLAAAIKNIFINLAAEIAALLVFRPVASGLLSAVGAGGLSQQLFGGDSGGGFNPLSLFSSGKNLLSLFNGGGTAAAAAGVGGGIAGMAGTQGITQFFASAAGGNIAAAGGLGAGLSAALPIAGIALAGLGALGVFDGLFGGGTPRETVGSDVGVRNGRLFQRNASTKGASLDQAAQFGQQVAAQLNAIAEAIGGNYARTFGFASNIGEKAPGTFFYNGKGQQQLSGKPGDIEAIIRHVLGQGNTYLTGGGELRDALNRSLKSGQSIKGAMSDVAFAKQILALDGGGNEAAKALEALNDQFDKMRTRATRLGLSIEKLNEQQADALKDMETQATSQLISLVQQARQNLGLDNLRAFRESLAFGNLSPLSPTARFAEARSLLDEQAAAALAGNNAAAQRFPELAQQVLGLGRDVYASGPQFAELFSSVNTTLNRVISQQETVEQSFGIDLNLAIRESSIDQIKAIQAQTLKLSEDLRAIRAELARRAA